MRKRGLSLIFRDSRGRYEKTWAVPYCPYRDQPAESDGMKAMPCIAEASTTEEPVAEKLQGVELIC